MKHLPKKHQLGFTLIELIMVLFIIAIMASMVGLSFSGAKSAVREERDRLLLVLNTARDYAILHGHHIRLRPNSKGDGYEFAERRVRFEEPPEETNSYNKRLRQPLPKRVVYWENELVNPIFKSHSVSEGVKLELEGFDGKGTVLITPTGDIQMGNVRISGNDAVYRFFIDENGRIESLTSEAFDTLKESASVQ